MLLNFSKDDLSDLGIILLLDFKKTKQQQQQYIKKIYHFCKQHDKKIGIKKHPRDFSDYTMIIKLPNTILLPPIAFETFLPFINNKTILLGNISTSLMLTKTLLNNQVFSVIPDNSLTSQYLYSLFKKIDINFIRNFKDIF
jgi:hypothetical protein